MKMGLTRGIVSKWPGMLFCILLATGQIATAQSTYTHRISGTIIDNEGRPVSNATVVIVTPKESAFQRNVGFDDLIPYLTTDSNGRFYVEEHYSSDTSDRIIYVATGLATGADSPIRPPFDKLINANEKFRGFKISLTKDKQIDLGHLPIQVKYAKLELELSNLGAGCIGRENLRLGDFWFRIRDPEGKIVAEEQVARSTISRSRVRMCMPEGVWHIEAACADADQRWQKIGRLSVSADLNGEVIAALGPAPENAALSEAEARQELERKAISIDNQSLIRFIEGGKSDIVRLLLIAGVDPNSRLDDEAPALLIAIGTRDPQIVLELLDRGANVNALNQNGESALMLAAGVCQFSSVVRTLLNKGGQANVSSKYGLTPLILAAANGCRASLELLLDAGADKNRKDYQGKTAQMYAIETGRNDIVELLLKHN